MSDDTASDVNKNVDNKDCTSVDEPINHHSDQKSHKESSPTVSSKSLQDYYYPAFPSASIQLDIAKNEYERERER